MFILSMNSLWLFPAIIVLIGSGGFSSVEGLKCWVCGDSSTYKYGDICESGKSEPGSSKDCDNIGDRDFCIEIIGTDRRGRKGIFRHCAEDFAYSIREEDWTGKSGACYDLGDGDNYCFCNDKDDCNKEGIKDISKGGVGSLFRKAWSLTSVFSIVIACLWCGMKMLFPSFHSILSN